MISLSVLNAVVLVMSVVLALLQIAAIQARPNRARLLFALFCASVSLLMCKQLSAGSIAPYHYLIGIGASATCNAYWLFSRAFFRRRDAIKAQHLYVAVAIALLVAMNQLYMFLKGMDFFTPAPNAFIRYSLVEAMVLLSSCILVLTFWEGCRGITRDSKEGKAQRVMFLSVFVLALGGSKIAKGMLADNAQSLEYIISTIILFVMVCTQVLLVWKYTNRLQFLTNNTRMPSVQRDRAGFAEATEVKGTPCALSPLARQVRELVAGEALYLQENLKVADIARQLDAPEYLISKAIRNELGAANFNQYVNSLRIDHSRRLLADPENLKTSILVIGLDSGFASVGPFTRAFKAMTGLTPSEYRQAQLPKRKAG